MQSDFYPKILSTDCVSKLVDFLRTCNSKFLSILEAFFACVCLRERLLIGSVCPRGLPPHWVLSKMRRKKVAIFSLTPSPPLPHALRSNSAQGEWEERGRKEARELALFLFFPSSSFLLVGIHENGGQKLSSLRLRDQIIQWLRLPTIWTEPWQHLKYTIDTLLLHNSRAPE